MKKVLSFLLVLSLVLGTFSPAFADSAEYAAQAEVLQNLEVLKGDDTGLNLDKELTRQEMMLMMARLMGEEDIATNFPFPTTFTDAQDAPWKWSNIIAWAEAKQLTNGMGDGTFGYDGKVTLRQLETYLLRALGYDSAAAWENAAELAAENNLIAGLDAEEGNVTKGLMAAMTINALKADKVDSEESLASDLGLVLPTNVVSVEAVEATVSAGGEVELPETVEVTYDNGEVEEVAVTWEAFTAEEAGDFTIEGTLEGDFDFNAEAVITVTEEELAVEVSAVGAKKLEVKFNEAVDADAATIELTKGSIKVSTDDIEFAEDNMSATITTTTNLTKGDYVVTVSGLTDEDITATVTAENEKVADISIVSDKAPRVSTDASHALVNYKVVNQYGETMTGKSITWTISTGEVEASDDTINGVITIQAAGSTAPTSTDTFIPGSTVYITGVYTNSSNGNSVVVNDSVEIVLASNVDKVEFEGVYDTNNKEIVELPAGFAAGRYEILFTVQDQYGNTMASPDLTKITMISNNPLFIGGFGATTTRTIDNVQYQAVELQRGSQPGNGGTVTIQAISELTGTTEKFTIEAEAVSIVKEFTMADPGVMIAETEKVEIPFTAVDQYGNAVTDYDALNGNMTLSPSHNGTSGLKFVEQYDGTAKLYYYAPNGLASANSDGMEYLTALVANGGSFSSLMLNIKDLAVPTAIIGLDEDLVTKIAAGNDVDIEVSDITVQDQYGRIMSSDDVDAWIGTAASPNASNRIVVTSSNAATSPLTVNGTDVEVQDITLDTDVFTLAAKTGSNIAGSEKLVFALSTDGGATTEAASAKSVTFERVTNSDFESYKVADLGTMYYNDLTDDNYNKEVEVYGVTADGTEVLLPGDDYEVDTNNAKLPVISNTVDSDVIKDVYGTPYVDADFTDGNGNYQDIVVDVLVTVVDGSTGAAISIMETELALSNIAPKVVTIATTSAVEEGNAIVGFNEATAGDGFGDITTSDLAGYIWYTVDQYGEFVSKTPTITITNLEKVAGSTFTVSGNATTSTSISGVVQGDSFTATYKYPSGETVTIDFVVGLAN